LRTNLFELLIVMFTGLSARHDPSAVTALRGVTTFLAYRLCEIGSTASVRRVGDGARCSAGVYHEGWGHVLRRPEGQVDRRACAFYFALLRACFLAAADGPARSGMPCTMITTLPVNLPCLRE
jgi:hypothetical protein